MVTIAFKGPAYTDTTKDTAALDALAFLAFSPTSDLYQKLVVQEQKADLLGRLRAQPASIPSLFDDHRRA